MKSFSLSTPCWLLGAAAWHLGAAAAFGQAPVPAPAAPAVARASAPAAARGVNLDLADGRQIVATGLRLEGDTLLATQRVDAGVGEIGYPLNSIKRIEFPEPPQLAAAATLLGEGKAAESLAQIDPIVAYYAPFRNVPGNWWIRAVLAKVDALAALKREKEIDPLLAEVARTPNNPGAVDAAKVRSAEAQVRRGNGRQAEPVYDEIIRTSADPDALAHAWVGKGLVLLAARDYEPALLACLRVPVFYPDNRAVMPPALLASARAFTGIDNRDKAREILQQLVTDYPASVEAAEARTDLAQLNSAPKPAAP